MALSRCPFCKQELNGNRICKRCRYVIKPNAEDDPNLDLYIYETELINYQNDNDKAKRINAIELQGYEVVAIRNYSSGLFSKSDSVIKRKKK